MKRFLVILCFIIMMIPYNVYASDERDVNIYFFHSNSCSHCKAEEEILRKIENKYNNVKIYRFEIHDKENFSKMEQVMRIYKLNRNAVPLTVIGDTIYTGYNEEKSVIKFVKTIEYYSIYPYQDRVMEVIDSSYDSVPVVKQDVPSLKEFMKSYHNDSLLGIPTDDMSVNTISIMLGFFTAFNLLSILAFFIVLFLLHYIGGMANKMKLLILYFVFLTIVRFCNIFRYNYVNSMGYLILFLFFFISFILYCKNKRRNYLAVDILVVLASTLEYLNRAIYGKYLLILKYIPSLHLLSGFDKTNYYSNYFISIIVWDMLVIIIIYLFFQKKLDR